MPQPRFEVALGTIDGINKVFTVSVAYAPNTTAVFVNGALYRKDWDNGWYETDPATGTVTLKEAPLLGDTVQIFFTDTSAPLVEEEVTPLHGQLSDIARLRGVLTDLEVRAIVKYGMW